MYANAKNFTLVNQCKETIWPATITDGSGNFHGEDFKLEPGQTAIYNASDTWSGRIWGRTGCKFDNKTGDGTCQTGSCGTSINCTSAGSLPVSIAEFTLGDTDFYDEQYNLLLSESEVCLQYYIRGLQGILSKLEDCDAGIPIGFHFTNFALAKSCTAVHHFEI
ncbi:Thaumatin family - like 5 [Theobroma cacao]|nr:Thaumatin family - like 5 [Theobroma cacao]